MDREQAFREISPWVEEPTDLRPPLDRDLRADVVIVGAGYTGLSTALSLRDRGVDVVLLEQGFAGCGASGRNAGHLTPTIGKDLPTLLRFFGRERATALVRFADAAVAHTEGVIDKNRIECDYVPSGNILAAVHPKHEGRLRKAADAAHELGGEVRFLSAADMRERGVPPAFVCGVLEERGGTLHPGRYVMALRRAALDAGVRLFEETRVVEVVDAPTVTVRTEHGDVTADSAVLASNAYTAGVGRLPGKVAPLRVSLFETEPLGAAELEDLGWRGREGIYTSHEVLESYRLTSRGTIVGGSKVVGFGFGDALPPAYDRAAFDTIEAAFRQRFPSLGAVRVAHFWGGWIGLTLDFLPFFGVAGEHRNVFHGVGYAGHGLAQATLVGDMLAASIAGEEHPHAAALTRRERRWPPEPLRWLAAQALTAGLAAIDRRTDRQAQKLGPETRG
jgi:gamma-glutamylputrescine oxidase